MQTTKKKWFLALIIGFIMLMPLIGNAAEEGGFAVDGIFSLTATQSAETAEGNESSVPLTIVLSGLMISVFIVTGAARCYLQTYNHVETRVAGAKAGVAAIINEVAVIHDQQLRTRMHEIEELDLQIEQLENQLQTTQEVDNVSI